MKKICIAVRSITYAQKGKDLLDRSGIAGQTVRNRNTTGCGWCIAVNESEKARVLNLFRDNGVRTSGEFYDIP